MSGPYAHMTVVNAFTVTRLQGIPGFPNQAMAALLMYQKYAELGSISPDYPFFYPIQKVWADDMHHTETGKMIHEGVPLVAAMNADPNKQKKCFAWLCGYAAHVATDVTVHPVVQLKSKGDSTVHRLCEMHQDAYIWERLGLGEIGATNHFTGLDGCYKGLSLDPDIEALWSGMLRRTYWDEWEDNEPVYPAWHGAFKLVVERVASQGHAVPFGRHLWVDLGALYPAKSEIDPTYIKGLEVPGGTLDYDPIFDRAVASTERVWTDIAKGVYQGNNAYLASIGNWVLDTGCDAAGNLVFWV